MGSMGEDEDPEIEMQTLANSLPATRKPYVSDFLHMGLYSEFAESFSLRRTLRRLWSSINIVIMSAKINLLLPFGPLCILLHYLTRKHVRSTILLALGFIFLLVHSIP